jgi:hypothetical protein
MRKLHDVSSLSKVACRVLGFLVFAYNWLLEGSFEEKTYDRIA